MENFTPNYKIFVACDILQVWVYKAISVCLFVFTLAKSLNNVEWRLFCQRLGNFSKFILRQSLKTNLLVTNLIQLETASSFEQNCFLKVYKTCFFFVFESLMGRSIIMILTVFQFRNQTGQAPQITYPPLTRVSVLFIYPTS